MCNYVKAFQFKLFLSLLNRNWETDEAREEIYWIFTIEDHKTF